MLKFFLIVLTIFMIIVFGYLVSYEYMTRDLQTPKYEILKKDGANIEIRQYPQLIIAEVTHSGEREQSIKAGFKQLAGYIFGGNKTKSGEHLEISMTAPVLQTEAQPDKWTTRFVMPRQFGNIDALPVPNDAKVKLINQGERKVVVIRFSGSTNDVNLHKHLAVLQDYVKNNNLKTVGAPEYAFYDPPWTLPIMRRNEILYVLQVE